MIDTSNFAKTWGTVKHELENNWTWESVLELVHTQTVSNPDCLRELGDGGFTLGGLAHEADCKRVLEFLQPLEPDYYARAGLYASLTKNSKSFPLHSDPGQHVWIWQILGSTPWHVDGEEFELAQGQLLYITPGTVHGARPNRPRASISFSLEQFD